IVFAVLNSMQLALQSGNLDLAAPSLPPAAAAALNGKNGIAIETVDNALNYTKLSFNAGRAELSNPEVRRAIAGLIDTESLTKAVMQDSGKTLVGPVLPSYLPKYQEDLEPYRISVDEAKQVITAAGLDKLSLEILCDSGNASHLKYAQLIHDALEQADIDSTVGCVERSISLTRAKSGEFDLYVHKLGQAWSPGTNLVQQYSPANPSGLYYNYIDTPELRDVMDNIERQVSEAGYV